MFKYILVLVAVVSVAAVDDDAHAHVEQEFKKDDGHGHFAYGFDATNGIGASESGDQKDVTGEYHYVNKDGKTVAVTYTADAEGYHPHGDVLPTAPPVPEAILKSLEYIKAHPSHEKHDDSHHHGDSHNHHDSHNHGDSHKHDSTHGTHH